MPTAGALPATFEGEVLVPGSPEYDVARAVWNGAVDRRPAYVVRCAGTDDVRAAVRVARELGLPLGVRGGGHSAAGWAVPDGGLMIDLSRMRGVVVDPARARRRCRAGRCSGRSTRPRSRSGWRRRRGSCRTPASAGWRSVGASAGSAGSSA